MGECQHDFRSRILVNGEKNQKKLADVLKQE